MATQTIHDDEFGEITIRRIKTASAIKIGVGTNGRLRATMPPRAPKFLLKQLIKNSRSDIRELLDHSTPKIIYENGMRIGKSHSLLINTGKTLSAKRQKTTIIVTIPPEVNETDVQVQNLIRTEVIKALRKEAKSYLPRRLEMLARRYGYSYKRVRFSHASTRWGSCSTSGTISLNIALMKLPFELIDYVIIHELCHTEQMNHSQDFWDLVAAADPEYKTHRRYMKSHTPTI